MKPLLILILVMLTLAGCSDHTALRVGEPVAPFRLTDLQGKEFDTGATRGKTTVIYFWNDQCGCVEQLMDLRNFIAGRKDKPFEFVTVNVGQKKSVVEGFVAGNKIPYTILLDPNLAVTEKLFAVKVLPTIFVINGDGILKEKLLGVIASKKLEAIITRYL